jgi:hypothetical protein
MKLLLTSLFLIVQLLTTGQVKQNKKKYLLTRFWYEFDKTNQRPYYKIIPDGWCDSANEVYGLREYNPKRNGVNSEAVFYFSRSDTSKLFYNYFRSPTEAFNYMTAFGWRVSVVFPDNSDNVGDQPNTLVSRQVFCFFKE